MIYQKKPLESKFLTFEISSNSQRKPSIIRHISGFSSQCWVWKIRANSCIKSYIFYLKDKCSLDYRDRHEEIFAVWGIIGARKLWINSQWRRN